MHSKLGDRPLAQNLIVVALAFLMYSVLADVLLHELELAVVLDVPVNHELPVGIFTTARNLAGLESECLNFHIMVAAALRVMTLPLTLLVEVESAIVGLKRPLAADSLLIALAIVMDLVSTLVLLDEMHRATGSVVAEYLELPNAIMTLPRDLAILNLEFLNPHLLTRSILLVPAFPDTHFYLTKSN